MASLQAAWTTAATTFDSQALGGVLKFCVVFPLLDFGKESPFPVPLLWARPLAHDLDKSTDCHSCSHRGTIKHLLKSTKYLHP